MKSIIIIIALIFLTIVPRFFTKDWEFKSFNPLEERMIKDVREVRSTLKKK